MNATELLPTLEHGDPRSEQGLRLRVPERCLFCGAVGAVCLEQTIIARSVTVAWDCHRCGRGWLVRPDELQLDRRSAEADRRKASRTDRRRRPRPPLEPVK